MCLSPRSQSTNLNKSHQLADVELVGVPTHLLKQVRRGTCLNRNQRHKDIGIFQAGRFFRSDPQMRNWEQSGEKDQVMGKKGFC